MKKLILVGIIILALGSCKMFSAMDTLYGAIEASIEYAVDELEE